MAIQNLNNSVSMSLSRKDVSIPVQSEVVVRFRMVRLLKLLRSLDDDLYKEKNFFALW